MGSQGWDHTGVKHQVAACRPNLTFCLCPDSGVGAGIDSYYEYLMKAYILLGDNVFLDRFNVVSPPVIVSLYLTFSHHIFTHLYAPTIVFTIICLRQHYSAIMKYISQPPLLLNVHMHNPTVSVRSWMDSLLAFFPGLQVRKGPSSHGKVAIKHTAQGPNVQRNHFHFSCRYWEETWNQLSRLTKCFIKSPNSTSFFQR